MKVLGVTILFLCLFMNTAQAAWLSGYSYRKKITITGGTGAGTNYQVKLNIGSSAGGDFNLAGHGVSFSTDMRFTDNDGTTQLNYWAVETTTDPVTVWVKVADDLGSNQDIYVYYGKSGDTSGSNGTNTFLFFDDFNAALDAGKWTTTQGAITTSGGKLVVTGIAAPRGLIESPTAISSGAAIHAYAIWSDTMQSNQHFVGARVAGDFLNRVNIYGRAVGSQIVAASYATAGTTANVAVATPASYHEYSIKWMGLNDAKYYQDTTLLATHVTNVPAANLYPYFYEGTVAGDIISVDWFFVRKLVATEPAFSTAGAEEVPSTGWAGKINGLTGPAKVMSVSASSISTIMGK